MWKRCRAVYQAMFGRLPMVEIKFSTEEVEMRNAYEWTCPMCGRDQFERAVTYEMQPGDPEDYDGMTEYPDTVKCRHCDCHYNTEGFSDGPKEEDDGDGWKDDDNTNG